MFSSPLQTIREDFGTVRLDQIISAHDSLAGVYTIDDGADLTATTLNPYSSDVLTLREQVLERRRNARFLRTDNQRRTSGVLAGRLLLYRRTYAGDAGSDSSGIRDRSSGRGGGRWWKRGLESFGATWAGGSNNGSNLTIARNLYTFEDRLTLTRGRHQLSLGAWFQPFQSNETIALSQYGQATFTSLQTFLLGTTSTFLYDPAPTEMNWRSLFGAFYAEDVIQVKQNLTLSLGFRDEFTTGWNEAHGRAANYTFSNGVISSEPHIGNSLFTTNNAKFLPQPRIGLAWSPVNHKTVIRAGFGMYNDLQDALGYRTDQNAPFNPTYSIKAQAVAGLPIDPTAAVPAGALLVPGGVQPDMKTPTLISWSLRVQQELSPNTSLTVGYVGSHGYHELIGVDANEPFPVVCPASPCPATYPATFPAPLAGAPVPPGSYYVPTATRANPAIANTWTWFSQGTSNYNALQVDVNRRFSHGMSLRGVYTWSKALDDGDSLNGTAAANAPGLVSNPFNLQSDYGLATYDVRHIAVISGMYRLPFGRGQALGGSLRAGATWRPAGGQ